MPKRQDIKSILVIGSGPIVIGQAAEFDYAGTQACLSLKEEGYRVILINSNPATIMTDTEIADKVYIEPISLEFVSRILRKERPDAILPTLGGQTGLNLTVKLYEEGILDKYNVTLLGTSVDSIQKGEDREKFRQLMIDIGEPIAESQIVETLDEGLEFIKQIGNIFTQSFHHDHTRLTIPGLGLSGGNGTGLVGICVMDPSGHINCF